MKAIVPFVFAGALLAMASCTTSHPGEAALGDTLTTGSGLQYYYVKKGTGPVVQTGSEVATYLSLKVNDKVVWNTSDSPDSSFVFVAGKSPLIKGFSEVVMFLREGDQIVAIMPAAIAYGDKGAGQDIPPNATLIYDQFRVLKVKKPKYTMADTLFTAIKTNGMEGLAKEYERITTSSDSGRYYTDAGQWRLLWNQLTEAEMHEEALRVIDYFNKNNQGPFRLFRIRTYNNMGRYQQGIDSLSALMESDTTYQKDMRLENIMKEMKEKLKASE